MAISAKGKRKITVNGKRYYWRAFDEYDQGWFDGVQLLIVAEDQSIAIRYGINQTGIERYLLAFLEREKPPISMSCPKIEDENGIFKPKGIMNIIEHCNENIEKNT